MTIAAKLLTLDGIKTDIKAALETKGIDMTDVKFSEYASKILEGFNLSDIGTYLFINEVLNKQWKRINDQFCGKITLGGKYEYGDRKPLINVSINGSSSGNPNNMVGFPYNNFYFANGLTTASITFVFQEAVIINKIIIEQSNTTSNGVWQLSGSNDNENFTDIGDTVEFGGVRLRQHIGLETETAYQYYRYTLVSGTTSSSPYLRNFVFFTNKRIDFTDLFNPSWYGPMAQDTRTRHIDISITTGTISGGTLSNALNALPAGFYFTGNQTNVVLLFTFQHEIIIGGLYIQQDRSGYNQGIWQLSGSNDNENFTDISTININGITSISEFSNTLSFKFYKLSLISGKTSSSPYISHILFKTAAPLLT